ncbi:MAG: hypothetical protein ABJB78_00705 [Betaproteobacteria bacterium]
MPKALPQGSPVLGAGTWLALVVAMTIAAGIVRAWRASTHDAAAAEPMSSRLGFAARVWSPAAATAVIGITFFFMMLLVGPWEYTEALADVARGTPHHLLPRGVLMGMALAIAAAMLATRAASRELRHA